MEARRERGEKQQVKEAKKKGGDKWKIVSEECALALALAAGLGDRGVEDSADGLIKDDLETLLGEGRALEVLVGVDLAGLLLSFLDGDRAALVLLAQLLLGVVVVAEIELSADKDDGDLGAVVADLRVPLGGDVLKGRRGDDAEADKEDVGLRVAQRTQTVVVLLSGCIPEAERDGLAVNHNVCTVVVKHSWDVLAREGIGGEGNEKACLTDSTITDNNTFDCLHLSIKITLKKSVKTKKKKVCEEETKSERD